MLVVTTLKHGGERYYLAATRGGSEREAGLFEPEGRWLGGASGELGLFGEVRPEDLVAVMAGVDPATGEVLARSRHRVANVAIDCMFAAPKSVSLLAALGDAPTVAATRAAHEHAVRAALGFLERGAARVRRGREREVAPATGFAAAGFLHRTSRAADPHLHTHVLVANLGRGYEGLWSALDARHVFYLRGAAGALYATELRAELTGALGCAWRSRPRAIDLEGISDRALRAFSRRSEEIRARTTTLARRARDLSVGYEELAETWRSRADGLGLSVAHVASVCGRDTPLRDDEARARIVEAAGATAGSFARSFTAADLIEATAQRLVAGAPARLVEEVVHEVLAGDEVLARPSRRHLSSARTVPLGRGDARYATGELAALEALSDAELRAARPFLRPSPAAVAPGVFRQEGASSDLFDLLRAVRALTELAQVEERPARVVVSNAAERAVLRALGAPGVVAAGDLAPRRGEVLVVACLGRLAPGARHALLEHGRDGSSTVVVVPDLSSAASRTPPPAAAAQSWPRSGALVVDGAPAALAAVAGLAAERDGAIAVVDRLVSHLVPGSATAREAARALRRDPLRPAVVLGEGARLGALLASRPWVAVSCAPGAGDGRARARAREAPLLALAS